jgi:CRP-like cAMP-binding protein
VVRAIAEGDAVVLALDVSLLNRLCAQSPEFSARLVRLLARQVERATSIVGITGSAAILESSGPPLRERTPAPLRTPLAESERAFAAAILSCALPGEETPLAVQGRLADLARESGLDMLDAYACLQRLLDRQLLRLVDDQLSILAVDELRSLCA